MKSCRDKTASFKGKNRSEEGAGETAAYLRDPGSESRVGGREKRRTKLMNGTKKRTDSYNSSCCTTGYEYTRVRMYLYLEKPIGMCFVAPAITGDRS